MTPNTNNHDNDPIVSKRSVQGSWVGIFMGLADSVPGISGGTVALVFGIYQRWISAIGHFDRRYLSLIRQRQFKAAAIHTDTVFLTFLAFGIGIGFVVGVLTIAKLLEVDLLRQYLYSAFIGMVVASMFIVGRMIRQHSPMKFEFNFLLTITASVIAAAITFATPTAWSDAPPIWYVFVAASIAICAMVLPGISGALLLLVLGIYKHMIDVAKETIHMERLGSNFLTIVVFAAGASIGIVVFSKFLKKMLSDHAAPTLITLRGLMLGSLVALWPFQKVDESSKEELGKTIFVRYLPTEFDLHWIGMALAMCAAFALVMVIDRIALAKTSSNH